MSNSPADEERLDSDPTDELPILLETAVLDPDEHRVLLVVDEEPTGEHTAHYPQLDGEEGTNLAALKSDLEQRGAKIAALEQDISRPSARWLDIERHLNAKDTVIADLNAALANLRRVIDSRNAVEQKLIAEIADRESQLERAAAEFQQLKSDVDLLEGEVAQRELGREEALQELERLKEQLSQRAAASSEQSEVTALREELATLTSYVANRRVWWDDLEARAAAQTARIGELERELVHRTERQQRAESRAEGEFARAEGLDCECTSSRSSSPMRAVWAAARALRDRPPDSPVRDIRCQRRPSSSRNAVTRSARCSPQRAVRVAPLGVRALAASSATELALRDLPFEQVNSAS